MVCSCVCSQAHSWQFRFLIAILSIFDLSTLLMWQFFYWLLAKNNKIWSNLKVQMVPTNCRRRFGCCRLCSSLRWATQIADRRLAFLWLLSNLSQALLVNDECKQTPDCSRMKPQILVWGACIVYNMPYWPPAPRPPGKPIYTAFMSSWLQPRQFMFAHPMCSMARRCQGISGPDRSQSWPGELSLCVCVCVICRSVGLCALVRLHISARTSVTRPFAYGLLGPQWVSEWVCQYTGKLIECVIKLCCNLDEQCAALSQYSFHHGY